MSRLSSICTHPNRTKLDARLAEGNGYHGILKHWKLAVGAVTGHA